MHLLLERHVSLTNRDTYTQLIPSEEFELTANSLGAHMKVTESSPGMGHGELILRTFIKLTVYSQDELTVRLL